MPLYLLANMGDFFNNPGQAVDDTAVDGRNPARKPPGMMQNLVNNGRQTTYCSTGEWIPDFWLPSTVSPLKGGNTWVFPRFTVASVSQHGSE